MWVEKCGWVVDRQVCRLMSGWSWVDGGMQVDGYLGGGR